MCPRRRRFAPWREAGATTWPSRTTPPRARSRAPSALAPVESGLPSAVRAHLGVAANIAAGPISAARIHISGAGGSTNSQSVGGPRSSGSGSTPMTHDWRLASSRRWRRCAGRSSTPVLATQWSPGWEGAERPDDVRSVVGTPGVLSSSPSAASKCATNPFRVASESAKRASESVSDASESVSDASESVRDASESVSDASERLRGVSEAAGGASGCLSFREGCDHSSVGSVGSGSPGCAGTLRCASPSRA